LNNPSVVLERTFASTHTLLQATQADFVSLMEPGDDLSEAAGRCQNVGTWPVLVGDAEKAERDTMLSSPIILYDYPQIAPESQGALFDATEIDEILTLRIRTMTESEKNEMRNLDAQTRSLLERVEALPGEALMGMHGTRRI
jgi:hydrogenase maturation protease